MITLKKTFFMLLFGSFSLFPNKPSSPEEARYKTFVQMKKILSICEEVEQGMEAEIQQKEKDRRSKLSNIELLQLSLHPAPQPPPCIYDHDSTLSRYDVDSYTHRTQDGLRLVTGFMNQHFLIAPWGTFKISKDNSHRLLIGLLKHTQWKLNPQDGYFDSTASPDDLFLEVAKENNHNLKGRYWEITSPEQLSTLPREEFITKISEFKKEITHEEYLAAIGSERLVLSNRWDQCSYDLTTIDGEEVAPSSPCTGDIRNIPERIAAQRLLLNEYHTLNSRLAREHE